MVILSLLHYRFLVY